MFGSLQPIALPAKHLLPTSQNKFALIQIAVCVWVEQVRGRGSCGKKKDKAAVFGKWTSCLFYWLEKMSWFGFKRIGWLIIDQVMKSSCWLILMTQDKTKQQKGSVWSVIKINLVMCFFFPLWEIPELIFKAGRTVLTHNSCFAKIDSAFLWTRSWTQTVGHAVTKNNPSSTCQGNGLELEAPPQVGESHCGKRWPAVRLAQTRRNFPS